MHELVLIDVPTIKLKVELFSEILLNVLNITKVSKTQMVDLMREVKTVSLHVQSLNSLRIVMSTNMEVTRHLVNKYKSAKLASLLIVQTGDSLVKYFLGLALTSLGLKEVVLSHSLGINFGVSAIFNVLSNTDLISMLIKAVFIKLTLDVDQMNTGHIYNIETEDRAGTLRQRDIQVYVQFFIPRVHVNHDITLLLILDELVCSLREQEANYAHQDDGHGGSGERWLTQAIGQVLVEIKLLDESEYDIFVVLLIELLSLVHFYY